jgi:hypothetical protein
VRWKLRARIQRATVTPTLTAVRRQRADGERHRLGVGSARSRAATPLPMRAAPSGRCSASA